jgi:hypothetical protein
MRLGRYTMAGALVGTAVALGSIVISIFQYNPEEVSLTFVIMVGLFFGVPVAGTIGAAIGLVWDLMEKRAERRRAEAAEAAALVARRSDRPRPKAPAAAGQRRRNRSRR